MHKIDITKAAGKFIKRLPAKQYRQVVSTILELRKDPTPNDSRLLAGYTEYHRVDIGEYRIVYRFDDDTVYIAIVGKRNDDEVYKQKSSPN